MREKKRLMKRLAVLLLLVVVCNGQMLTTPNDGECQTITPLKPRPHSVSVLEFGAVGDGKTSNTVAFQNAIFYLKSFADKGGAQLFVPAGRWLTGCINLTSHLTLFLDKDAVILGSQDYSKWDVVEPLPSYGRGIEVSGGRYRSLISGNNLTDVVITGNNGTIDGQGEIWWDQFNAHVLNYSRPHLVEFLSSTNVVISNLTFINAPSWNVRPAYCSYVVVQNITIYSPPESPYTTGIVPDSSTHVCIENSNISMNYDAISLKSGWDEYGISYGKPTTNVHIRGMRLQSFSGSGVAFGSEMSGGISDVVVEQLYIHDSLTGIEFKTAKGRGGYMREIIVSGVQFENVQTGLKATGQSDSHPDDKYDPSALPVVGAITFENLVGTNITLAGSLTGLAEAPFSPLCLSNISFSVTSHLSSWICSFVSGSSVDVFPEPCPELQTSSSSCTVQLQSSSLVSSL